MRQFGVFLLGISLVLLMCGVGQASVVLGTGTGALLGGDLTDPENDIDDNDPVSPNGGANFNWVNSFASEENHFSPGGPSNEGALDLFDNKVGASEAKWCCGGPEWVTLEFAESITLTHFTIASANDVPDRDPSVWEIQGSNDNVSFTTIYRQDNPGVSIFDQRLQVIRFDGEGVDFATPEDYKFIRYQGIQNTGGTTHQLAELEYFGFVGSAGVPLTWDGTPVGNWGDSSWVGTNPPPPPNFPMDDGTDRIIAIIDSAASTVTVEADHTAFSLDVTAGELVVGAGNSLAVTQGVEVAAGATLGLQDNASLTSGSAINVGAGNPVTLGNAATLLAGSGGTIDAVVATSGTAGIGNSAGELAVGSLSDGGTAGVLTKLGAGSMTVGQITTVAGSTLTIAGGVLEANGVNPLGDAQQLTLPGGTFKFNGQHTLGVAPAGAVTHWAFDEGTGFAAVNSASPGTHDGTLMNFPGDDSQWVEGRIGTALEFDGADDLVEITDWQGVSETLPRTMSAWVKTTKDNAAILSWGIDSAGEKWIFRTQTNNGQSGAIRVEVNGGYIVGNTDIRDDLWHHVAAVLPDGADNVTQMALYVDGQPEVISASLDEPINTAIGDNVKVGVGQGNRFFDGSIDDVYVYDRALSDAEVEGIFGVVTPPDMANTNVLVTADSVLESGARAETAFGTLTMVSGALTTSGRGSVSFSGTTIPADVTRIGFDPQIPTDYGTIANNSTQPELTIVKAGPSTWALETPLAGTTGADNVTWEVNEGALQITGSAPLAGRPVVLTGGTLQLAAPIAVPTTDPGPVNDGMVIRFDASNGVTAPGGVVSNWVNSAPSADGTFDAIPGDGIAPAFVADAFNGNDVVRFDGTNQQRLTFGAEFMDLRSVLWVLKEDADSNVRAAMLGHSVNFPFNRGVAPRGEMWQTTWASPQVKQGVTMLNGEEVVGTATPPPSEMGIVSLVTTDFLTIIEDGNDTGVRTGVDQLGQDRSEDGRSWDGDFADVIIYNTPLSNAEMRQMIDHLAFRYGIPVEQQVDFSDIDVTITEDSTLDLDLPFDISLNSLTLGGGTLNVAGRAESLSTGGTTISAGVSAVGINTSLPVSTGPITADGVTPVTITKTGDGDLVLDATGAGLEAATFNVQQGALVSTPTAPGSTPLQGTALQINGGNIVAAGSTTDGAVAYDNPVVVDDNGTFTAGSAGNGTTGVAVTLGSAANGVTLNNGELTLQTTDDYTLDVAGPLAGPGTLAVSQGAVALSGGGDAGTLNITGGSVSVPTPMMIGTTNVTGGDLTLGANLDVSRMKVTDAAVNTGGNLVVVSNRLQLGDIPFTISPGGTFAASGADLAAGVDLALSGGTLAVGAPASGPADPAAYWNLDELAGATLAVDSGPSGYNGTVTDAVSGEQGIIGNAFRFDGDNDYVDFGPAVAEMQSPAAFSVAMWFNRQTDSTGGGNATNHAVNNVLMAQSGQSGNDNFEMGTETDVLQLYVDHSGGGGLAGEQYFATVPEGIANDEWHHVAVTYDSAVSPTLTVYFNGGLLQEWTEPNGALAARSTNSSLALGVARTDRGDPWGDFDGFMDEVYLFDRALTGEEVSQLFTAPDSGMVLDLPTTNMMVSADTVLDPQTLDDATFGNLQLDAGVALTINNAAASFNDVTAGDGASIAGDLLLRGTIEPSTSGALMSIDGELEMEDDAGYVAKINGAANDVLALTGDAFVGGTLTVQGLNSLPDVGDTSRTILMTEGESAIDGAFSDVPDAGDHLGAGIFATDAGANGQVITQNPTAIDIDLFQAIAGDTDGNRDVNGFDIQAILAANKFGTPQSADWTEGDFTNDGVVNGFDIQAILAANKFGTGPYAAAEGGVNAVPEPGTIALLLSGLAGLVLLAIRRRRRTY